MAYEHLGMAALSCQLKRLSSGNFPTKDMAVDLNSIAISLIQAQPLAAAC